VTEEEIGYSIIGAAIKVHSVVGPGLLHAARMRDGIVRMVNGI
jgi:hypothetical protein